MSLPIPGDGDREWRSGELSAARYVETVVRVTCACSAIWGIESLYWEYESTSL
jgi:hypothetical protein